MHAEWLKPNGEELEDISDSQEKNLMAEMLEQYLECQTLERGQIISGTVVRIGSSELIVDVGAKCEGVVPEQDLARIPSEERETVAVGDEILVYVLNPEDANGNIVLSLSRAQAARDWRNAEQLLESQEVIEREAINSNKGGVIVQMGRVRGFVPGSQLSMSHRSSPRRDSPEEDRWASVIGETLQLKVIEVDQKRNRLILSERAAMRDQRKSMLDNLKEGEVYKGQVSNLVDFGAFVDLGGIDGLIHISELSWKRISHPKEVLNVGQEVEVYILKVDRDRQRVALSLKRLQADPWQSVEDRYEEGQVVEATITRFTKWGAFASIIGDEAIEGLIHISELDDHPVVHPREVVQPGDRVTLRVIDVDAKRHRLALSLKQAVKDEYTGQDWRSALTDDDAQSESAISVAFSEAMNPSKGDKNQDRL